MFFFSRYHRSQIDLLLATLVFATLQISCSSTSEDNSTLNADDGLAAGNESGALEDDASGDGSSAPVAAALRVDNYQLVMDQVVDLYQTIYTPEMNFSAVLWGAELLSSESFETGPVSMRDTYACLNSDGSLIVDTFRALSSADTAPFPLLQFSNCQPNDVVNDQERSLLSVNGNLVMASYFGPHGSITHDYENLELTDQAGERQVFANGFSHKFWGGRMCVSQGTTINFENIVFNDEHGVVDVRNAHVETSRQSSMDQCGNTSSISGGFEVRMPELFAGALNVSTPTALAGSNEALLSGVLSVLAEDGSSIIVSPDSENVQMLSLTLTSNGEQHRFSQEWMPWRERIFAIP